MDHENLEKVLAAIKVECDRQHVGVKEQQRLHFSYDYLRNRNQKFPTFGLKKWMLLQIAGEIEARNEAKFRVTPITFNGLVGGSHPDTIPDVMNAWLEYFNSVLGFLKSESILVGGYSEEMIADADEVIKEFLSIHPFIDGNGRTAWLLRVWMLNQWDDPQPLPDYFGENNA